MAEIAKIKGYDIRDKKLADATSQSTVAATDAIEMKTTSGDQVYITRDSFVQEMASVLNSNSQSTISQLFGADANGNHAAINMSNLALVLGSAMPFAPFITRCVFDKALDEQGNEVDYTGVVSTPFISATGGNRISFAPLQMEFYEKYFFCAYNSSKELTGSWNYQGDPRTVTLPANTAYVRLCVSLSKFSQAFIRDNTIDTYLFGPFK